jgi:hypothetical protein
VKVRERAEFEEEREAEAMEAQKKEARRSRE